MPTLHSVPLGAGFALFVRYLEVGGEHWIVHLRGWERDGRMVTSDDALSMCSLDVERLLSGLRDVASGTLDEFVSWDWAEGGPERVRVARAPANMLSISVATTREPAAQRLERLDADFRTGAPNPDIIRFETSPIEVLSFATRLREELVAAPRLFTK